MMSLELVVGLFVFIVVSLLLGLLLVFLFVLFLDSSDNLSSNSLE